MCKRASVTCDSISARQTWVECREDDSPPLAEDSTLVWGLGQQSYRRCKGTMKSSISLSSQILERAKTGDVGAFEQLYRAYKHPVFRLCLKKTGDIQDAEDLTQEVFVRVYCKVNGFRGDAAFSSWLFRVTLNTIMMHLRKRRTQNAPAPHLDNRLSLNVSDEGDQPQHAPYHPIDHIALARALGELRQSSRRAVMLHDIEGMSYREIAKEYGVPASTSKAQVWRAHRQMREILKPNAVSSLTKMPGGNLLSQAPMQ